VLAGRVASSTTNMVFQVLLMTVVGVLVGFRFHGTIPGAVVGLGLLVLVGLAFSCIAAFIGLLIRDPESAQAASGIWIFPLVFASGIFVPVSTMPGWLQGFAKANPITIFVEALRGLTGGGAVATPLWQSLVWVAGIVLVAGPVAVRQYRKVA
jgi:ABC-2 type transport system permease protein/oleandomycin transport system permease protein